MFEVDLQHLSRWTASRMLNEAGIFSRRPSQKPHLTAVHKENRLRFAIEHIHYGLDFWRRVLYTE